MAKYIWRKKSDEKEKNPVWADRNRNQFVYEWVHGTDAEGEMCIRDRDSRITRNSREELIDCGHGTRLLEYVHKEKSSKNDKQSFQSA